MARLKLLGLLVVLVLALLFAVFVGDLGPWYFAWVVGTVMIVLVSVASAILLEKQEGHLFKEESRLQEENNHAG